MRRSDLYRKTSGALPELLRPAITQALLFSLRLLARAPAVLRDIRAHPWPAGLRMVWVRAIRQPIAANFFRPNSPNYFFIASVTRGGTKAVSMRIGSGQIAFAHRTNLALREVDAQHPMATRNYTP